jgi:SAM-dependent methyltransferase
MKRDLFDLHAEIESSHWWFVARRRIVARLVRQVLPPAGRPTIVDVGCGTGANIAALASEYDCVGIDTTPAAIELARKRFPAVRFACGTAPEDLGTTGATADLFLLMDVLEHVPDDFAMLSAILSRAAPGAQVLITVPAHEALWSEHDVSFGHYRRYELDRLARIWAGLPVTVRLLSYYNSRLYPVIKGARSLNRLRGQTSGRAGTDFDIPVRPINRLLTSVFAGEARPLGAALDRGMPRAFRTGVSLIAVLRRESGEIRRRSRPVDVPADGHIPNAAG